MGSFSIMHWLVVLAIVMILFGAGKLPRVMGDFAKGIKAFKSGMREVDGAIDEVGQIAKPITSTVDTVKSLAHPVVAARSRLTGVFK